MGNTGGAGTEEGSADGQADPRSLSIAERGIKSSGDFRDFMSAVMEDTIRGVIDPAATNAVCNAGGKLLKMVDMEYRYATDLNRRRNALPLAGEDRRPQKLSLASGAD